MYQKCQKHPQLVYQQIDTPSIPLDPIETEPAEPGTASPRVNLPSGSPPRPTVTATC